MEATMGNRYLTEGYGRFLKIALLAVCLALGVMWKENRDLEIEKQKTPPACLVNSTNGIDVCSEAPKMMPLFEPDSHDYVPPPP
jgi:hypothetical protein